VVKQDPHPTKSSRMLHYSFAFFYYTDMFLNHFVLNIAQTTLSLSSTSGWDPTDSVIEHPSKAAMNLQYNLF
jgi:hypothetical protein